MILSIDVGIRNLAFCKLDAEHIVAFSNADLYDLPTFPRGTVACVYTTWKLGKMLECLRTWEVLLPPRPTRKQAMALISENVKGLPTALSIDRLVSLVVGFWDARADVYKNCDVVYIENQPSIKNPSMKNLQIVLATYFVMRGVARVAFVHASGKLKLAQLRGWIPKGKCDYKTKKRLSVELVNTHIMPHQTQETVGRFEMHSKKDDIADCILQGLYASSLYNGVCEIEECPTTLTTEQTTTATQNMD